MGRWFACALAPRQSPSSGHFFLLMLRIKEFKMSKRTHSNNLISLLIVLSPWVPIGALIWWLLR